MSENPSSGITAAGSTSWRSSRRWRAELRDEYGDSGRELALYLGRRLCGMKLAELAQAVGLRNYGVVATNVKPYERRLEQERAEQARMKQVLELLNCEM
ncbi:MAG: hypothetical protein FJ403_12295 [Verrucomicrobia bacterium]|nr:hypothetical protein [Verrucomicrobiota bacterium]